MQEKINSHEKKRNVALSEEAKGDTEFMIDGTCVHTMEGWREETKRELLESGFEKIDGRIVGLLKERRTKWERKSLEKLRGYWSFHSERWCYCERLREG